MVEENNSLKIVNDKAIFTLEEDKLDFKILAKSIEIIIKTADTPVTIGVYGEWGAGKTSIMRLTRELISDDTTTIWFNAWKFDQVLDLRVALIHIILNELKKYPNITQRVKDFSKKINWLGVAKASTNFVMGMPFTDIGNVLKQDETITLISEFDEKFRGLINDYKYKKPLVIFIDDLDRCLPEKSIDILETIKLFLDAEGCVFIIGANKQIIDNIIKYRYKDIELEGSEYLDKIIQVSFNVPRLGRGDAINFIEKIAPVPIIEYKEIISHAGGNPRKIKRTINKFILQMIISETYEFLKQNIDKAVLAKLVVLELAWNDFYNDVIRNHNEISGRSLTLQNLKILLDSSVKDEKLQEFKYLKDPNLISFLDKYPKLWEINLSPYIYLSKKLDIDTSSSKDGIPSSCPHCGKKRLTKWSRKIDGNSGNDFEEGFQCYACGAVYYFNENHKDGFIWRETAPRCSDCNAIMLWVSYGGSEGAYGNYEDDFVFKCPKCSKIG